MPKEKDIMTTKDVAGYLKVHPLTVQRYARGGQIPAFKIGSDWRFHKKHIDRWIKENIATNRNNRKPRESLF